MDTLGFEEKEYRGRLQRAQELMQRQGLDALLITDEVNFSYFTGHRVPASRPGPASYSRPLIALLPRAGDPIIFVHSFQAIGARRASWVPDLRSFTQLGGTPVGAIVEASRELGADRGRIGAELGYEQRLGISFNDFVAIKAALPGAEFVDGSDLIWSVRMTKSPAEIACMRRAGQITAQAYDKCFSTARPGITERKVAEIMTVAMMEYGADRPGLMAVTVGYGDYERGAEAARMRPMKPGEMLWMDCGAIYNNYWADYSRAGVLGKPTREQLRLHELICDLTRKGVEAVRPGVTAAEIARVCSAGLEAAGYRTNEAGRIGHGLGLMLNEPPHIALYDQTVLRPGMVITVEPGIVTDDGAYHVEENVVVTEDGCEVLSACDRHLRAI